MMRSRTSELGKDPFQQLDDIENMKDHNHDVPFSFASSCRCCLPKFKLHTSHEVPSWMARPYIKDGYRPHLSVSQCFASLVYFHNESINIWSHLIGAIVVIYLAFYGYSSNSDDMVYSAELFPYGSLVLRIFLLAAAGCLLASATYHAGNCNNDKACCDALLRIDATGVATLIAASFLPGVYFGFACYPELRTTYLYVTAVLLVVGVGVSFVDTCATHLSHVDTTSVSDPTSSSDSNPVKAEDPASPKSVIERIRVITFVSSVFLGGAGIVQWAFLVSDKTRSDILPGAIGMFLFYGIGFGFYITNFPERSWPGLFDYVFHSHQFWHVCVVAAILVWYAACVKANTAIAENGCSAFIRVAVDSSGQGLGGLRATSR